MPQTDSHREAGLSQKGGSLTERPGSIQNTVVQCYCNNPLVRGWPGSLCESPVHNVTDLEKTNSMNSAELNFFLDFPPNWSNFPPILDP